MNPMRPASISKITSQAIALSLFCIALITKVAVFDFRTLALDEPFSLMHAQESLSYILQLPFKDDPHPPLYYLLLHVWIKTVGLESIACLKFFSVLIHAITAWSLFRIASKHFGLIASVTASVLFIFADAQFFFALDLRAYPLMTLLSLISSYLAYELARNPDKKRLWGSWALVCALLFYTHYFGLLLVFFQWVYITFRGLDWRQSILLGLSFSLLSAPGLIAMAQQFLMSHDDTWMSPPVWEQLWTTIYYYVNGQQTTIFLGLILLGTIVFYLLRSRHSLRSAAFFYLIAFFVVYFFMFVFSFWVPVFSLRYTVFLSPLLFLGAVGSIDALPLSRLPVTGAFILISLFQVIHHSPRDSDLYYRDLDSAVAFYEDLKANKNIPTLLYPYWFHHGFLFHYDRDLFSSNQEEHYRLLNSKYDTHAFWDTQGYLDFIAKYDMDRFIAILDEFDEEKMEDFSNKLRSIGYVMHEKKIFKECTYVGLVEKQNSPTN